MNHGSEQLGIRCGCASDQGRCCALQLCLCGEDDSSWGASPCRCASRVGHELQRRLPARQGCSSSRSAAAEGRCSASLSQGAPAMQMDQPGLHTAAERRGPCGQPKAIDTAGCALSRRSCQLTSSFAAGSAQPVPVGQPRQKAGRGPGEGAGEPNQQPQGGKRGFGSQQALSLPVNITELEHMRWRCCRLSTASASGTAPA